MSFSFTAPLKPPRGGSKNGQRVFLSMVIVTVDVCVEVKLGIPLSIASTNI